MHYEQYQLNVNPNDPGFEAKLRPDTPSTERTKALPESYSRPVVTPVMDQGALGSCVGCATKVVMSGYYPDQDLSALWIYKKAQQYDDKAGENYSGTTLSGACLALSKVGVCLEKYMPYTSDEYSLKTLFGAIDDAATRKIDDYFTVDINNVAQIQELLMREELLTSFNVHEQFYTARRNGVIDDEDRYLEGAFKGGHAMALVGWHTVGNQLLWKFQNSWGTDFGDQGFVYISHELYSKISKGVYVIVAKGEDQRSPRRVMSFIEKLFAKLNAVIARLKGLLKRP